MQKITSRKLLTAGFSMVILILACNVPGVIGGQATEPADGSPEAASSDVSAATAAANPLPTFAVDTPTPALTHTLIPATNAKTLKHVYDVDSSVTAAEKRAPYGDSYKINRFERPFLQDMTYIPDLDIYSYSFGEDTNFFYASFELIGVDPNNKLGINYGVEIDLDADGFGDYIVWAHPPYPIEWTTDNVQVFADKNHDTGGLSAEKSDAPLAGDGYDTLIFNGGHGDGDDPDLAWVRVNAGLTATVQIAFKKSLGDDRFMYGVISDSGIKDVGKLDYIDRYTESEAGSPEKSEKYYPLKAVFAVDNVCRETYGFTGTGEEPQRCPVDIKPESKGPRACPEAPPPGCLVWDSKDCICTSFPIPQCLSKGTQIDTPNGAISVEDLQVGDLVWTLNESGNRIAAPLLKVSHTAAPANHRIVHVVLADHREMWVSPGHPTSDGRTVGILQPGDLLDGVLVTGVDLIPYNEPATYDILPDGGTGFYWANGILIGSTLTVK